MTLKVTVTAESSDTQRGVYRLESLDGKYVGEWTPLSGGIPTDNYIYSERRIVVEEYDPQRHGRL